MVREDGSDFIGEQLDRFEDCTRETQIMPGYWAPRVHCMNLKVVTFFYPVDP